MLDCFDYALIALPYTKTHGQKDRQAGIETDRNRGIKFIYYLALLPFVLSL